MLRLSLFLSKTAKCSRCHQIWEWMMSVVNGKCSRNNLRAVVRPLWQWHVTKCEIMLFVEEHLKHFMNILSLKSLKVKTGGRSGQGHSFSQWLGFLLLTSQLTNMISKILCVCMKYSYQLHSLNPLSVALNSVWPCPCILYIIHIWCPKCVDNYMVYDVFILLTNSFRDRKSVV